MTEHRVLHGSLIPLLLLASSGAATRCRLATDSGTGELQIRGTVLFVEVGAGCWRLDAGAGRHYELVPDHAPASLLQHGATATVTAQVFEAAETGCRVGLPLAVRRVVSLTPAP